jgi:hypothetical protein
MKPPPFETNARMAARCAVVSGSSPVVNAKKSTS